eukprot:COSAG02_NODE_4699_length_5081_cov_2.268165_2_plen_582_part_00
MGEERACFLPKAVAMDYDPALGIWSKPDPLRCAGVVDQPCHGFCIGPLECTRSDIMWETDFALTIFDWQNLVYLVLVVGLMGIAKHIFRQVYQLHLTEDGFVTDIQTWWKHATAEPAVLMCLAAYIYSVSNITHAAITEFESVDRVFHHVGYSTQMTSEGFTARLWNIASAVGWAVVGLVLMQINQLVVRKVMFSDMDGLSLQQLVASGVIGPDAKTKGSNVAAGIVEAGCVVASGMVASAAISGAPSMNKWGDLGAAILYFVLSQVTLVVYMKVFDIFYIEGTIEDALQERLPPEHHLHLPHGQKCDQGNVASAITFVAMAISFSIHISQAVYTSFELLNYVIVVVCGGGLQLLMRPVLRRLIIIDSPTTDEAAKNHNWGFAMVVGSLQIYFARVLASLVSESCVDVVYNPDYYCTTGGWDCADDFTKASNATEPEVFKHSMCWEDEDICISSEVHRQYSIGSWSAVQNRESKCMPSNSMPLGDRLMETDVAWSFFSWSRVWQVLTTLAFLFLAKIFFGLPYTVHAKTSGGEGANLNAILVDRNNHALCISFAGYIFGFATVIESQFHTLNLSDLNKVFE